MADATALHPCPFCGCQGVGVVPDASDRCGDDDAFVECPECLTRGPIATQGCNEEDVDVVAEAARLWNERPETAAIEEKLRLAMAVLRPFADMAEVISPQFLDGDPVVMVGAAEGQRRCATAGEFRAALSALDAATGKGA